MLVCELDGTIPFPSEKGMYLNHTRIISDWSLYADGERWDLLSGSATGHDRSSVHLTNRKLATADGPAPARTLGMVLTSTIDGGLHEDIDIANHGSELVRFNLEIGLRCDFADMFEVKGGKAIRRGEVASEWHAKEQRLETGYINGNFRRYGFTKEAARIAHDLSAAASHVNQNQMPELYAGLPRTPGGFPLQYVGANVPQGRYS